MLRFAPAYAVERFFQAVEFKLHSSQYNVQDVSSHSVTL